MALTKSLPLELVDMILGWARLDPKTLVACSYVCKAWKARSQAMLFRDIPISLNRHQLSSLDGVLSQSPELGQHIRSFGIEVKVNHSLPWNPIGIWITNPPHRGHHYSGVTGDFAICSVTS